MAGAIKARHWLMAAGRPGKFTTSDRPAMPATARDKMAVGTFSNDFTRMISPNPGNSFSMTDRVASGVTSRSDGPVPPVVTISGKPSTTIKRNVSSIAVLSSGSTRTRNSMASSKNPRKTRSISGPLKSSRNQAYETLRLAKASQKQARRKVKDLKGIRVAPGLKTILENILETQKLQQQSQKLILDALGDFKKQTREYCIQSLFHPGIERCN